MKKFLWITGFLLAGMLKGVLAQNIDRFEYFFDTDPGAGNGTSYVPAAADSVTVNLVLNITGLPAGHHKAGFRARYADGKWSHAEFRSLFIVTIPPSSNTSVTRIEYFLDTDPGVGSGTAVNFSPADSVTTDFAVDITSIPAGHHRIGIRSLNTSGIWSHTEYRTLFIVSPPGNSNQEIVQGEMYIGDTDPGIGLAAPIAVPVPGDSITILRDSILNNLPQGQYKLNLRFKDNRGVWSHQETRVISVCTTYGAQSEFEYLIEGNRVFFTNNSLYEDTVSWKFGDNTVDTVYHPVKTYANAGNYNVQLITGNSCGVDTLDQAVEIRGLQRVNANRAGNAGVSTLMYEGFGFTASTNVKLILGAQVFNPVTKIFLNSNRIRAYFDLTGLAPGWYRAVATLGGAFDTLNNALLIENDIPVELTLNVPNGKAFSRPGRMGLNGVIINRGSQDAVMVPYVVTANVLPGTSPANMTTQVDAEQVPLLNEGIFQHTYQYISGNAVPAEVMFFNDLDTARKRQLVGGYITRIGGHSSVQQRVRFPHPGSSPYVYQVGAAVLGPLLDSYALLDSIETDYQACYSSFLKRAVERELNVTVNDAGWNNCFVPAFDTLMRTLVNIAQNPVYDNYILPMQAGFSALLAQMAGCAGSGVPPGLGGIQFKRVIQHVMSNWIYLEDTDSLDYDCVDTTVQVYARMMQETTGINQAGTQRTEASICQEQCDGAAVFPEMCDQCLPLILAGKVGKKFKVKGRAWAANSAVKGCQEWCETTSIDPNAKYGPGNNGDRKYINHLKEVNYKITFENLASATAPAAFVEIRDTIDKSVFDMASVQLGAFSWGDSIIMAEPNEQNVSILKNIKPAHPNFLRIDAVTDTAEGIIRWRFWTVDTVTLQLTDDPTEGFLPPNTDGVSGAGYVTFSIAPNSAVGNGSILKNKAVIVFDNNAPIETDEWEYRIDTLKPASAVNSLPPVINTEQFTVSWAGSDANSGVHRYNVYVSVNDSAYRVWQSLTDQTSAVYPGQFGKTYRFFSIALDHATNFEDPPFDPLANPDAVTTLNIPLPLDLLSFIVRKSADQKKADLAWTTVNEQDVSHFELQRSADGINYVTIARVPALNQPSGATYTWQDAAPLLKINHYRLRMVDLDATYKFSPVRQLRFGNADEILVFPTITSDAVFVQSERELNVELFNASGIRLKTGVVRRTLTLDLSAYAPGVYFIRIPAESRTFKIIRQ